MCVDNIGGNKMDLYELNDVIESIEKHEHELSDCFKKIAQENNFTEEEKKDLLEQTLILEKILFNSYKKYFRLTKGFVNKEVIEPNLGFMFGGKK